MARASEYLIVREIATNELRICRVVIGYRPRKDDPDYRWAGPFPSVAAARKAVVAKDENVRRQLYDSRDPQGEPIKA